MNNNNAMRPEGKRRRKEKESSQKAVLAENIPGFIGDKDVEYLAEYISGENSNQKSKNNSVANLTNSKSNFKENGVRKKNNGDKRRTASDRSSPTDASLVNSHHENSLEDDDKTHDGYSTSFAQKLTDGLRRANNNNSSASHTSKTSDRTMYPPSPPASPHQAQASASSVCGFVSRDDLTDVENLSSKGYLSDQDAGAGFQLPRNRRHRNLRLRQAAYDDLQNRRSLPNSTHVPPQSAPSSSLTNKPSPAGAPTVPRPAKKFNSVSESKSGKEKQPKVAAARCSSSCDTTATPSSPPTLYNGNIVDLPPVIMFDDNVACKSAVSAPSPSFTFGFFDDVKQPAALLDNSSAKIAVGNATSDETNVSKPTVPDKISTVTPAVTNSTQVRLERTAK